MGPWLLPLLGQIPELLSIFTGSNSASGKAAVVGQIADIAMKVAGVATPDDAARAIAADPNLALQFKTAVLAQQTQFAQIAADKEKAEAQADVDAMKALTDRIGQLEGTASDLKAVPVLGPAMLFMRGAQRPVIGYAMMYLDYMVFSGAWTVKEGPMMNLFFLMNALVLAFLFGERAIKNVAPMIGDMLQARFPAAAKAP